MELSIVYGKIIGFFFMIVSIAILVQMKKFAQLAEEISQYPTVLYFLGIVDLVVGLILVVSYNVWVANWEILITITGWIILLKGLVRIFAPDMDPKLIKIFKQEKTLKIAAIILLIIGLYLLYSTGANAVAPL